MTWNTERTPIRLSWTFYRCKRFASRNAFGIETEQRVLLLGRKSVTFLYIVGWFRILDTGVMGFSSLLPDS